MKTPEGTKWYEITETHVKPGDRYLVYVDTTERLIECVKEGCGAFACGYDVWLGGRVDRTTHLRVLSERLGARCRAEGGRDCPHPEKGVVT